MFEQLIGPCRFLLENFPGAELCRDYLNNRLAKESQELFQFGYFPNTMNLSVLTDFISESQLRDKNLIFSKDIEDSLYHRTINFCYFEEYPLILPIKDAYGNVMALVGRTLLSDSERSKIKDIYKESGLSKYKYTKGFSKTNCVFGIFESKNAILEQDCVYVVEGQFDAIKAIECGMKNVVSVGGSDMSSYQFSIINRYTNNIFLLLDNDEAGDKGRKRIINKFGGFANIRNFYIPDGFKDIDEYLSKNSFESLSFTVKD